MNGKSSVIYDRGNWKQVFKNHQSVKPNTSAWNEVGLPSLDEIPNLDLEVIVSLTIFF